jgi:hypothetical protein
MNRPDRLSLSAIIASRDGSPDSLPGLSAVMPRRLWLVVPALCALVYPSLLSLLSSGLVMVNGAASPNGEIVWLSVFASLTLALAVMLVSFVFGLALGSPHVRDDPESYRARSIAHLAFATPSLYVGFGNVAYYVFQAPSAAPIAWLIFWALVAAIAMTGPRSSPMAPAMTPIGHRRLALAHGVSACAILLLFIGPHIVNHTAGFWNGAVHIALMNVARLVYRNDIVQPILLALIGFQILSGTALVRWRMRMPGDFPGTAQTMSAVFVGAYFLAHMIAVFATRHAGTDTNWTWLTRPNGSMLTGLSPSNLRLLAHYWVGPIAIVAHVACGLRMVLLRRDISPVTTSRIALALIAAGVVTSSIILAALLNVHIA